MARWRKNSRPVANQQGYTLLELLVVGLLVIILVAAVIYLKSR